jgi:hypothetical protein
VKRTIKPKRRVYFDMDTGQKAHNAKDTKFPPSKEQILRELEEEYGEELPLVWKIK